MSDSNTRRKAILWVVGIGALLLLAVALLAYRDEVTSVRVASFEERRNALRNGGPLVLVGTNWTSIAADGTDASDEAVIVAEPPAGRD